MDIRIAFVIIIMDTFSTSEHQKLSHSTLLTTDFSNLLCKAMNEPNKYISPCDSVYMDQCNTMKLISMAEELTNLTAKGINNSPTKGQCNTDFHCIDKFDIHNVFNRTTCRLDNNKNRNYVWAVIWITNDAYMLLEWLVHHLLLGVSRFLVYDNRSTDNIKAVLQPFIAHGLVEYHYDNHTSGMAQQAISYNAAIAAARGAGATWLLCLDVDEFVALAVRPSTSATKLSHRCLPSYLRQFESDGRIAALAVNWRWIPSTGKLWRARGRGQQGGLKHWNVILESGFRTGMEKTHAKCIVHVNRTKAFVHVHHARYREGTYAVSPTSRRPVTGSFSAAPETSDIAVLHYHPRSFEEYLFKIERWKRTSYYSKKFGKLITCRNCNKTVADFASEYLSLVWNTSYTEAGSRSFTPELQHAKQHKPTEMFLRRQARLAGKIIPSC